MGYSSWGQVAHDAFDHRTRTRETQAQEEVFAQKGLDAAMDPKEKKVRESRDSDAHPHSRAIAVFFDETGSMGEIPERFAKRDLGKLMRFLVARGYVEDPQLLFGAIGDAVSGEQAPLQVGEFESGIEMDDWLTRVFLEGGGGGQGTESYELALHWAATRPVMDCLEKRGKKGHLFIVGDEMPYPTVSRTLVRKYLDDMIEADIPIEEIIAAAQEKFEVFFIHLDTDTYGGDFSAQALRRWRELLGERALHISDPSAICELIGATIALCEGRGDLEAIQKDLAAPGTSPEVVASVVNAVQPIATAATA